MKIVTLAAGLGSRLEPSMNESIPKALVSIGSETVLERQVRQLSTPDRTEHIAVVGRQGACWTDGAFERFNDIVDEVVINETNAETEAGYSFLLGLNAISSGEDVLVIDGDIIIDDDVLEATQTHEAENIALVRAVGTKIGVNNGACVKFEGEERISQCGFDLRTNYVYSGVMRLSGSCVETLSEKNPGEYENKQLATLINKIARENILTGYTVSPRMVTTPVVEKPLDGYDGVGKTTIECRKGKIIKRAITGRKKLRDEIERLQYGHTRYPEHFPELLDISFFSDEPSYEMPNYAERGYTPLDELIQSGLPTPKLSDLTKPIFEFMLNDFSEKINPLPSLYKNAFLPKIRTRYKKIDEETASIGSVMEAESVTINGHCVPGLPKVIKTLEKGTEFLGQIEPPAMTHIHGDFKPDNILIDKATGEFILLDPRGRSEIGTATQDPLYDISKFLTSTKGYYMPFKRGDFDLSVQTEPSVAVEYKIYGNLDAYNSLTQIALKQVEKFVDEKEDWRLRLKVLIALLLISNAPVHVDNNNRNRMATAELVRGLELFDEALEEFNPRTNQTGDVVNINTDSDLKLARKLFEGKN
jgi:choline kinase